MTQNNELDPRIKEVLIQARSTAVHKELLTEIGRVVANFALLEGELFILIHWLLGTKKEISRIVTSELSFRNLLDLSASLVKEVHGNEAAAEYGQVLKLVSEAEDERNRIIHSRWGSGGEHAIRTKHTSKRGKGHTIQRQQYTEEDLYAVSYKISWAIFAVENFRASLGYRWTD